MESHLRDAFVSAITIIPRFLSVIRDLGIDNPSIESVPPARKTDDTGKNIRITQLTPDTI